MPRPHRESNINTRSYRPPEFARLSDFQLQELNNMILNSWIITYTLIEPFIFKAKNFDDFVQRFSQITNLDESSLNHIKGKSCSYNERKI